MRLLTKIIGRPPGEMEPDELTRFVQQNRVRIRKEIKEYRRLKAAIRAESPTGQRGRPKITKAPSLKKPSKDQLLLEKLAQETGLTVEELMTEIKAAKEKKDA